MGVNHGATIVYGYKFEHYKTYDDIPDHLTDKAYGDYPGGREVLEKLMQKHEKLGVSRNPHGKIVIGAQIGNIHRTGTQKITHQEIDSADTYLLEFDPELRKIADLQNQEPQVILHSTMRG